MLCCPPHSLTITNTSCWNTVSPCLRFQTISNNCFKQSKQFQNSVCLHVWLRCCMPHMRTFVQIQKMLVCSLRSVLIQRGTGTPLKSPTLRHKLSKVGTSEMSQKKKLACTQLFLIQKHLNNPPFTMLFLKTVLFSLWPHGSWAT